MYLSPTPRVQICKPDLIELKWSRNATTTVVKFLDSCKKKKIRFMTDTYVFGDREYHE